jgi:hypothetical protein
MVWGLNHGGGFSLPIWTGPGAHPASHAMGAESFEGVKRLGCGIDHVPPSSFLCLHGQYWGELYIYLDVFSELSDIQVDGTAEITFCTGHSHFDPVQQDDTKTHGATHTRMSISCMGVGFC